MISNDVKILICGDSFAVDYTVVNKNDAGWSSMLTNDFTVTNCAQAGISEYKILKQLENQILDNYTAIIVTHTSPYRVHIKSNPMHLNSDLHKDADLIYNDVISHYNDNPSNTILKTAKDYFEHIFDDEYYQDVYYLIVEKIKTLTRDHRCLHLLPIFNQGMDVQPCLDLKKHFKFKPGLPNHYSPSDNKQIYNLVKKWVETGYV